MPFDKIPGHDPQGLFWQGFEWSGWYDFAELYGPTKELRLYAEDEEKGFTRDKALYRFRDSRRRGLLYIGETSRSAQTRIRGHSRGMRYALGELTLAPGRRLLGFHRGLADAWTEGRRIQASWTAVPTLTKSDRRGVEAELIAAYRATMGRNPDYQWPGEDSDDEEGEW